MHKVSFFYIFYATKMQNDFERIWLEIFLNNCQISSVAKYIEVPHVTISRSCMLFYSGRHNCAIFVDLKFFPSNHNCWVHTNHIFKRDF